MPAGPEFRLLETSRPSQREPVAVRVGEIGVPAPIGIDDRLLLDELDPKRFQALELAGQVAGVDDACTWDRARRRIGLARSPRPENNLQILTLEADRHELDPAGGILLALFETQGLDVEIERLVLIPNEQRYIRHLLEHFFLHDLNSICFRLGRGPRRKLLQNCSISRPVYVR